jgi:spore maturation protein CgeB
MDIACFGASLVSAYENGAATYCRGVLRALSRLGHHISFYEPLHPERLAHRDIVDPAWARIIRFTPDGEGVEAALAAAAKADVLIKSSGVGAYDDLLDGAVPHATMARSLSVYWDLDPGATLERLRRLPDDPLRAQLPWYDLVLVRCGGESTLDEFQRFGARTCFPIYNALDADVYHSVPRDAEYAASLVYLGHRHPDKDARLQRHFFEVARSLPTCRFVLGGCGWEGLPLPANVLHVGYVYAGENNLYNCSSTAVLSVTSERNIALGHVPAARLFEAAGAGACVITDAWRGLDQFFEPGRELLVANEPAEVVEHLLMLSKERSVSIGKRAQERAIAEHSYAHRAAELAALVEGADSRWAVNTAL